MSRVARIVGPATHALLGTLLAGCACAPGDPSQLPVARIGAQVVRRAQLDVYLKQNLVEEGLEEPGSPEDLDRVKSRLFDNFMDERLLLAEADRLGVQVTEEEVSAWLESGGEGLPVETASDPVAREAARRELRIQKLREAYARSLATVAPEEVGSYLGKHRRELEPAPRLFLQSVVFPTESEAQQAHDAVRSQRLTLDRVEVQGRRAKAVPVPVEAALGRLPQSVQAALRRLKPGEVSPPVEVEGGYALFLLEARPDEKAWSEESLRERAREALLAERYQQASERLLEDLRRTTPVVVHHENLPFRYVPEGATARKSR